MLRLSRSTISSGHSSSSWAWSCWHGKNNFILYIGDSGHIFVGLQPTALEEKCGQEASEFSSFHAQLACDYSLYHLLRLVAHQYHCYEQRGETEGHAYFGILGVCLCSAVVLYGAEGENHQAHLGEYRLDSHRYLFVLFVKFLNHDNDSF